MIDNLEIVWWLGESKRAILKVVKGLLLFLCGNTHLLQSSSAGVFTDMAEAVLLNFHSWSELIEV